ncbi:MAG: hypothetical protein H8E44_04045 [Planctomycetes bacterium]|nr:hypothetical protein [Planctomycetota bacterium]
MSENDHQPKPDVPEPWRPRFGVGALLMVMLVCSVTGAAGFYLVRSLEEKDRTAHLTFILFTLAAPILLMVVVSAIRRIVVWLSRR